MTLALDRVAIESVGSDPLRLARAVLKQLPEMTGRVPIDDVALSLDILSIERAPLCSIEACLQCDPHKSVGQIVVNAQSSRQRQRYSIGHELGHFLNETHEPVGSDGFDCSRQDMVAPHRKGRHLRQEREANTFAIEVLTPRRQMAPHLAPAADLEQALAIAERFDISKAAAVRRYADLHPECTAVVFSQDDRINWVERPDGFPGLRPWNGQPLGPIPPAPRDGTPLTGMTEVDAAGWLANDDRASVFAQTLYQQGGHAITLLLVERVDPDPPQQPVFHRSRRKP